MLGILLSILRIAGCILLIILMLILVIAAIVLFDPILYRLEGEKDAKNYRIFLKVTWLFGAVRVRLRYPDPGRITIKAGPCALFDRALPGAAKGEEPPENDRGKKPEPETETPKREADISGDDEGKDKDFGEEPPFEHTDEESKRDTYTHVSDSETEVGRTKRPRRDLRKNLSERMQRTADRIGKMHRQADYYIRLLQNEDTKILFSHVGKRLGKILKNIVPRRIEGHVEFGTGSPDTTGYVMALYGILYPHLGERFTVTPDFESAVIDGNVSMKGRITLGVVAWHGLKLGTDRRLRQFINRVRKGGQING